MEDNLQSQTPVAPAPVAESSPTAASSDLSSPAGRDPESLTVEPAGTSSEPIKENILGDVAENVKPAEPAEPAIKDLTDPAARDPVKDVSQQKPEDKKITEESKADAKPEETKVLPSYEPFNLPENISMDAEPVAEFTKLLGELETSKLDHDGYQATGQKLIDMHLKGVQESINRLNDYYTSFHEHQKAEWFNAFKNDPEIGGEKITETVDNLRNAVEVYGGTPEQVTEFRQIMKYTGVGNHPALIRILSNMDKAIRKYTTEGDGNRMVPAQRPAPSKVKDYQRFYTGGNG